MKLLLLLLSMGLLPKPDPKFVLIDRELKKPPIEVNEFTLEQPAFRTFPIYTEDVTAVKAAAEAIAKKLQQKMGCLQSDTVTANHTRFIIRSSCRPYKSISIRLLTKIDEQRVTCGFELVQEEDNYKKIQRQLLDFSSYLAE